MKKLILTTVSLMSFCALATVLSPLGQSKGEISALLNSETVVTDEYSTIKSILRNKDGSYAIEVLDQQGTCSADGYVVSELPVGGYSIVPDGSVLSCK